MGLWLRLFLFTFRVMLRHFASFILSHYSFVDRFNITKIGRETSLICYDADPEGDFVECIGRQDTPEAAAAVILDHIKDWKKTGKPLDTKDNS